MGDTEVFGRVLLNAADSETGTGARVVCVWDDSISQAQGVGVGETIVEVDGVNITTLSIKEIRTRIESLTPRSWFHGGERGKITFGTIAKIGMKVKFRGNTKGGDNY